MARRLVEQIVVRVPAPLLAALRADATANGRTVAQTVRFHLTKRLLPDGADPA